MEKNLQIDALIALGSLIEAAHRCNSPYVADQIDRAKKAIENPHTTADEKLNEAIGVSGGLSRGEWDRLLVDLGGLPYFSTFEVPISVYQYCATLELESSRLEFVREQIERLQRALEFHRARIKAEQGVAHQRAISCSITFQPPSQSRPWADI
ncbi:MAG: hypothetical protein NTV46_10330 [Verrucomicrobia bacterium]|nr:hypothetical protein [Verrucomicrobiota bacterium]